jgi:hypothetical protein
MNNASQFQDFSSRSGRRPTREGLQRREILGGHQNTFLAPVRHGLEFHAARTSRYMG